MHQAGPGIRLLHLLTLAGFAVAQPLYDLLGRNPDFFIARHAHAGEIGSFIFTVSILIPLLLFVLVAAAAPLGRAVRTAVHGLVLLVLAADHEVALVPADRAAPASADTAGGYRLAGSGKEGGELVAPDGTTARIEAGALEGWLDGVYMNGGLVQFSG